MSRRQSSQGSRGSVPAASGCQQHQHFREQPFLQECLDSAPGNEERAIPTLHPGGVGCGRILKRAAKEVICSG